MALALVSAWSVTSQTRARRCDAMRSTTSGGRSMSPTSSPRPVVVVIPSFRTAEASPPERRQALERSAATIHEAIVGLGDEGPQLALEPLNRFETYLLHTLGEADEMRRYIDLPRVGILADAFHMNIEEDDMAGALAAYGRHIVSVDIADNQRRRPGSGQLDFRAFLAGLSQVGYRGWLNMECVPADEHSLRAGRRHIEAIAQAPGLDRSPPAARG